MFRNLTPVVRALLYTNLIVFGLVWLTPERIISLFALWPWHAEAEGALPFEPWQLISYAFVHQEAWHLFGNMLALYMFGPTAELTLGPRRFTFYYLACAVGAALTQLTVNRASGSADPTIGASGAIFGLLLFYGVTFPQRRVLLLFPPIPMPAWLFVTLYGVLELYLGVFTGGQGVAHFAHLGGLATGCLLLLYWRARAPKR